MITRRRLLAASLAAIAAPLAAAQQPPLPPEPLGLAAASLDRFALESRRVMAEATRLTEAIVRADIERWFELPEGTLDDEA